MTTTTADNGQNSIRIADGSGQLIKMKKKKYNIM